MVMVLPDTAVTCVLATTAFACGTGGVFAPILRPVTTMPTVMPAKDGTVSRVIWSSRPAYRRRWSP